MNVQELVEYFKVHSGCLSQGNGYLTNRLHSTKEDIIEAKRLIKGESPIKMPKILLFDVETAPMRAYVWGRWKQNVSLEETISEWFILCWSAKWLYSNEVISDKLTPEEAKEEFDLRIVKHLWQLLNEADIVIAYNGKKADIPWANTRFIVNGLLPPAPYYIIDPCEVARKSFGFSSNKLDALAGYFGIEHKMETGFSLWDKAVRGDQESLNYMSEYCTKDVRILEEVYLKLRPYIKNHPNIGNYASSTESICSACGSIKLTALEDKFYYTPIGKYQLYRCKDCGAVSRGRVNLNKELNRNKVISVSH